MFKVSAQGSQVFLQTLKRILSSFLIDAEIFFGTLDPTEARGRGIAGTQPEIGGLRYEPGFCPYSYMYGFCQNFQKTSAESFPAFIPVYESEQESSFLQRPL